MEKPYYEPPKPSALMRFFWRAAGADSYILQQCTYADHVKYFCLGGIVVATGMLAGLAGGYAFYTIFEPKGGALDVVLHVPTMIKSVIFGIIWGLIILTSIDLSLRAQAKETAQTRSPGKNWLVLCRAS